MPTHSFATSDVVSVTNGKTFTTKGEHYELITSHELYGTKDYLAYVWGSEYAIWFFDDLSNVKFNKWDRGANNFGLYPSINTTFTSYTYDKDTLVLKNISSDTIRMSNAYNYGYDFIASFNIYTDNTYSQYFYEAESNSKPSITFEPLKPQEAKEFLRFISNAGWLTNMEQKLPKYYNLLIGKIKDPEEELEIKISFLTYCYYCLNIQLNQANKRIDIGTTYLIEWVEENSEASSAILSTVKGEIIDNLQKTIAENIDLPGFPTGINTATAILDYGQLAVHAIGSIKEVRHRDNILYLYTYRSLLKATYENDEIAITLAQMACDGMLQNQMFGGDKEEMERYAQYFFDLEQSLLCSPF